MFGGGDVSLQDILRQVSQELENEGMQGISGGLFESVSGGSYNGVAPYTSLLLHRASGIKDIIHLIRLLSRTDPRDEQLVQVLAHFVRMPVADVKKMVPIIRYQQFVTSRLVKSRILPWARWL